VEFEIMKKEANKKKEKKKTKVKAVNVNAVPRVERVLVNVGVGKTRDDKKHIAGVVEGLKAIAGQAPHECRAKKAVAGFKVREGNLVGYRVTLRGQRMDDFIKRFIGVTLPRVRDFRGISVSSFDGKGNLSVGLTEQLPFPEVQVEKTDILFGVQVTFVTTAKDDKEGEVLFRSMGFPLTEKKAELDQE
jgi:large subunit ribosomal protein L5